MNLRNIIEHIITVLIIICIIGVGLVYIIQAHDTGSTTPKPTPNLIYTMIDNGTMIITEDTTTTQ